MKYFFFHSWLKSTKKDKNVLNILSYVAGIIRSQWQMSTPQAPFAAMMVQLRPFFVVFLLSGLSLSLGLLGMVFPLLRNQFACLFPSFMSTWAGGAYGGTPSSAVVCDGFLSVESPGVVKRCLKARPRAGIVQRLGSCGEWVA
jgi:hypothetical protein